MNHTWTVDPKAITAYNCIDIYVGENNGGQGLVGIVEWIIDSPEGIFLQNLPSVPVALALQGETTLLILYANGQLKSVRRSSANANQFIAGTSILSSSGDSLIAVGFSSPHDVIAHHSSIYVAAGSVVYTVINGVKSVLRDFSLISATPKSLAVDDLGKALVIGVQGPNGASIYCIPLSTSQSTSPVVLPSPAILLHIGVDAKNGIYVLQGCDVSGASCPNYRLTLINSITLAQTVLFDQSIGLYNPRSIYVHHGNKGNQEVVTVFIVDAAQVVGKLFQYVV